MCGIVGYLGYRKASTVVLTSLQKLEYRGYDSCGVALRNGGLEIYKDVGVVSQLGPSVTDVDATIGIGHTRWATHGKPSRVNAHPHTDSSGRIAVVHNGIINNYQSLRDRLTADGGVFVSETDTEAIPHLIRKYYKGCLVEAVERALQDLDGSYAIAVLSADEECIVAARKESPLIIGVGEGEWFLASDVPAILEYTDKVIYLEDGDVAAITRDGIAITNGKQRVQRGVQSVNWHIADIEKAGYAHYMLKEIHEQPRAVQETLNRHMRSSEFDSIVEIFARVRNAIILGCGSSHYAGLVGQHLLEGIGGIPAVAKLAADFCCRKPVNSDSVVLGITQSGETADTLNALKHAVTRGYKTIAITNVPGSSVTRVVDSVIYTAAGPEVGVASTKSFTTQLMALYSLALALQESNAAKQDIMAQLRQIPGKINELLDMEEHIAGMGRYLAAFDYVSYISRGINMPIAMEGALKLKEVAYIHAEGCNAGELKHGPFALLTPQTPVVAIASMDDTYDLLLTNIKEIKSREAPVIAIAGEDDDVIETCVDYVIRVPSVDPLLSPIINAAAVQLLAYYAALERGCPIDKPRNLAKSVTVV
jgi:glucosamine--fructose-6-phosphate aminotransferase (isomerizing)